MPTSLTRTERLLILAHFGRGNHPRSLTRPLIEAYRVCSLPLRVFIAWYLGLYYLLYDDLIALFDFDGPKNTLTWNIPN